MTITIEAREVARGLHEWLDENPWFVPEPTDGPTQYDQAAAQHALSMLVAGDSDAFQRQPARVRGLAVNVVVEFMVQLSGPLAMRRWVLSTPTHDLKRLAWLALWQELGWKDVRTDGRAYED